LEAKMAAERELYDRAMRALEDQNAELRSTRAALQVGAPSPSLAVAPPSSRVASSMPRVQALEADAASLRARCRALDERDAELRKAREDIRSLEVRTRTLGVAGGGGGRGIVMQ
jgi:prefoldin subunit 5